MADNITSGGVTYAADDISGIYHQRIKLSIGADGSAADLADDRPMPVCGNTSKDGSGTWYSLLQDSDGHLQVDVLSSASVAVTNAGTFVVQENGAALTALQLIDDVVHADSAAFTAGTDKGAALMGLYESSITAISDGDVGVVAVDSNRRMLVSIEADNAGIGGSTQYAEDAAHASGNTGTMSLAVRQDTPADLSDTDGDYEPLSVSGGRLWASTLVTGDALTALQLIDDAIYADDAAFTLTTSKVMAGGAIRDDTLSTLSAVEGDVVPLRVSSTGALHVTGGGGGTQYSVDDAGPTVVTMAGVVRDDSLTTLTEVDGDATVLRVNSTGALHVTGAGGGTQYAEDAAHTTGDTGTMALGVRQDTPGNLSGTDGDYEPLQVSAGRLWTSTLVTGDALTALQLIDDAIYADDDAFTLASSKVMAGGAIRDDTLSTLTAVEGDVVPLRVSSTGALHVTGSSGSTQYAEDSGHTTGDTGTMALGVRQDTPGNLSDIDGDYEPLSVSGGRLWASTLVTGDALTSLQLIDNPVATISATDVFRVGVFDASDTQVTSFASTQYAEDSAHASENTGTMALAVRQDTPANLSDTDGDYEPLSVSGGRLWASTLVTGDALTALQLIDDPIATISATPLQRVAIFDDSDTQITSFGGGTEYTEDDAAAANPVGGASILIRTDTPGSRSTTDGDNVAQCGTDYGAALVQLVTSSGAFIDSVGGGTQYNEDAAHTTGDTGTMSLAVRQDTPGNLSGTDGDYEPLQVSAGRLWASTLVTGDALTALQLIDDPIATISATPLQRVAIFDDSDTQITSFGGGTQYTEGDTDTTVTGTAMMFEGDVGSSTLRTPSANNPFPVYSVLWDVDSAAFSAGVDKACPVMGFYEASITAVSDGDVGVLAMDADRKLLTINNASASGGATPGRLISAATDNSTNIKSSAGTLYMCTVVNTNASARYLKFYDKSSAPTVGTDVPVLVFTIPGNSNGAGIAVPIPTCGLNFASGIGFGIVTGAADSDTTAVAANEIVLSYAYK